MGIIFPISIPSKIYCTKLELDHVQKMLKSQYYLNQ
jgi:hypothetical protein